MKIKKLIPLVLLAMIFARGVMAADAALILQKASSADKQVSYRGFKTATVCYSGGVTTARIKVIHMKPDKTRTEYFSPPPLAGIILLLNGSNALEYDPSEDVWARVPRMSPLMDQVRQDAFLNYDMRLMGVERVAGRPAFVVQAVPKFPGEAAHRVWVDMQWYLILGTQVETSRGAVLSSSRFVNIEFNSPDIKPDTFKYPTPRRFGCQAAASQTGAVQRAVLLAQRLQTNSRGLHGSAGQLLRASSVFQRCQQHFALRAARVARVVCCSVKGKVTHALTWAHDGILYTLMGNIPDSELHKIAKATK